MSLNTDEWASILVSHLMTSTLLVALIVVALLVGLVLVVRRGSVDSPAKRRLDLGAVSARWLSELRRDDPWS